MDGRPLLTDLNNEDRAAALERFRRLQPHLEGGVALDELARMEGIPLRTAQRWVSQYRADGLAGLARKPRRDADHRHLPLPLVQLIEGLVLRRPRIPIAAVHRQAVACLSVVSITELQAIATLFLAAGFVTSRQTQGVAPILP